jgi:hypothetical protein
MIGSTPIDWKIFGFTDNSPGASKKLFLSTGVANNDLNGNKVPANGSIVKLLIIFLRFISEQCL